MTHSSCTLGQHSHSSPRQYQIQANELEERFAAERSAAVLWFASCRPRGSGAWLHALQVHAWFRVSSDLYQIMSCLQTLVMIPATTTLQWCVCGYDGPFLPYGMHWFAQCHAVLLSSSTVGTMLCVKCSERCSARFSGRYRKESLLIGSGNRMTYGRSTLLLVQQNRSLTGNRRGFDVGVADPTQVHLVSTGQHYFKKGKASSISRKKSRFNYLASQVVPVPEVSGTMLPGCLQTWWHVLQILE